VDRLAKTILNGFALRFERRPRERLASSIGTSVPSVLTFELMCGPVTRFGWNLPARLPLEIIRSSSDSLKRSCSFTCISRFMILGTFALYLVTALAEILGCYT
jgi:hypothetical protein